MINDNNNNFNDEEVEKLFKDDKLGKQKDTFSPKKGQELTKKIVQKARSETSTKTISEYSLVNFWTVILEFINIFCSLLDPKKETNADKKNNKEQL